MTAELKCTNCKGSLEIPADISALSTKCPYCGQEVLLPKDVLKERKREQRALEQARIQQVFTNQATDIGKNVGRTIRLTVFGSIAFTLVIMGFVFYRIAATPEMPVVTPAPTPSPSPPTVPIPVETSVPSESLPSKSPGIEEVTARMKELYALGCTDILQPAIRVKGTTAWTPRFLEGENSNCLNILAATGSPNKGLTLWIRTPLNEKIEVLDPVPMMDYIYCAKNAGPHPLNVISPTNDRYTFAAVDCPRKVAQKILKEKKKKKR